jgi:uncharacterized membrane-anchored protein YhcB (DUF1043 family)
MLAIIMFVVGIISGMYIITQIQRSIFYNIKRNKMKKRLEEMDKRKRYD